LVHTGGFPKLKTAYVGGAQVDCSVLAQAIEQWPTAQWMQVYGGSEAEPIALCDARRSLEESRKRGLFQALYLGAPIEEVRHRLDDGALWVAGPNVCPEYLDSPEENRLVKKRDSEGTLWHCMGDRIRVDGAGWWYDGRASQPGADFDLEQRIYSWLGSSASFVHRAPDGKLRLCGEGLRRRSREIREAFPEIHEVIELSIQRDRRHRARIDRKRSLEKGAACLVG
jgi:acyl-CoA synthetase (AMP-forming)/AMP-acid ligase II